ncbi:MAG TPA: isocitrate lyase/phosphoenolpyruvate mutase family protein [Thermoleophilaceae bacterium]|nr:isocitrate lyase/phosphoenolpyruvate mutase family protein [Thermoleophilaceae bacterium]
MEQLTTKAERLRELHAADELLVLANVWDVATARFVAGLGHPAVATASAAVTASLGYADADSIPPDEMFAAVGRIAAAVEVPVTADVEAGYELEPTELVDRLLQAGAVGLNIEDTDHHGDEELVEAEIHALRLRAVKAAGRAAGVDVVLNARVDAQDLDEALRRARIYREVGADCIYPIHISEAKEIKAFVDGVDAPANVLVRAGSPTLGQLRALGVARVSFGPGLQHVALGALERFLGRIDPDEPVYPERS